MALIANLRHYLGENLSLIEIPAPAATLREFLGCIAEAVTSRNPCEQNYGTNLRCWCCEDGIVVAYFDKADKLVILWRCTSCDERGQLTGWEGTLWDKSS